MMSISQLSEARDSTVYFGTSSVRGSEGIYSTGFDAENGLMQTPVTLAAEIKGAGWITPHPSLPLLYASGVDPETGEAVAASFRFNADKSINALEWHSRVATGTGRPTHLMVHPSGRLLASAHYGEGAVALFSVNADGTLRKREQLIQLEAFTAVDPDRQEKAHPHYATFDPSGNYLLIPDLGADAVYVYRVDPDAPSLQLHEKVESAPGSGPRHMKFTECGNYAFVLNELSLTLDTCSWDAGTGTLKHLSSIPTLPDGVKEAELENTASEIRIHPNGRFVYAGNRGNDSISVFALEAKTGKLERIQVMPTRTAWPRNFALDPTGAWLICGGQDSDNAGVFSVNPETGLLTYQPHSNISVPSPICVLFKE